jgi:hypothetical protein
MDRKQLVDFIKPYCLTRVDVRQQFGDYLSGRGVNFFLNYSWLKSLPLEYPEGVEVYDGSYGLVLALSQDVL